MIATGNHVRFRFAARSTTLGIATAVNDRLCGQGPRLIRARCTTCRYPFALLGNVTAENDRLAEQEDSCNRLSPLHCHCEPVRTLAWQSPGTINRLVGTKIY